jgi:hypothetical protein
MRLTITWVIAAGLTALFVFQSSAQSDGSQKRKALMMTRLYTGPDGQTHAEEMEAKFSAGSPNEVFKLMGIIALLREQFWIGILLRAAST